MHNLGGCYPAIGLVVFGAIHQMPVIARAPLYCVLHLVILLCAVLNLGLVILLVFDLCDNSMREKDWRCRKRGMQAT